MLGIWGGANCQCEPTANAFVQEWFSECIYTTWEFAAFCIGMSSVMFWIVAQMPQFISNLRNQSAEALSPWFLFQWLAGDSFNLLGCLLTGDQLATETFTATYFIFADCIIISQYIYYNMRAKYSLVFSDEERGSLTKQQSSDLKKLSAGAVAEFQNRLANISIVVPDEDEGLEPEHHKSHQYYPVTFVAGRSGASMIAHAMQSPRTPLTPLPEQNSAKFSDTSLNPTKFSDTSANPTKFSDTSANPTKFSDTPISATSGLARENPKVSNFGGNPDHAIRKLRKPAARASRDRGGQFRTREERNSRLQERKRFAEPLGALPEIDIERLFPSRNAMKRHLRRLINEYGLDSGPPSTSKVTIHHAHSWGKSRPERRPGGESTEKSRLWQKGPVKAAACMSVLLTVTTSTNYFQRPGISGIPSGLAIGSRRMLTEGPRLGSGTALEATNTSFGRAGEQLSLICGDGIRPRWVKVFGTGIGWASAGLYFGSRFSQLAMNHQRRSTEGLSLAMLGCAILANTCMGLSILMRAKSLADLTSKAPWILGSIGTVSLDVCILLQAKYLDSRYTKRSAAAVKNERTPLLA